MFTSRSLVGFGRQVSFVGPDSFTALSTLITDTFSQDPPQLKDLLKEDPVLQKIAEYVHNLVISAETEHLALIQANTIEVAFRHILNETMKVSKVRAQADMSLRKVKSTVSASRLQILDDSDSQEMFQEVRSLQQENFILKEQLNDKHEGNLQLQQEVESLHGENNLLLLKNSRLEKELEKCVIEHRLKESNLEDKYHEVLGKCKIAESAKASLESQLQIAHEEYESLVGELKKAKQKVSQKRERINSIRSEIHQLKAQIDDKDAAINNLKLDLSMSTEQQEREVPNEPSKEEMRLHGENGRLSEIITGLTEKIKFIHKEKLEQEALARAEQNDLSETIIALEQKLDDKDNEISILKDQVIRLKENMRESRVEQDKMAERVANITDVLQKIQNQFGGKVAYQELPDLVRRSSDHSFLKQRICILNSHVVGMSVFVSDLLSGSTKLDFRDDLDCIPSSTYESLEANIAYCKKYATESGISVDFSLWDAVFGSDKDIRRALNGISCDDYVAILAIFASITRNITEKHHLEKQKAHAVCSKLNLKTEKNSILQIVKYCETLYPISVAIADLLQQNYGASIPPEKVFSSVRDYLQEFVAIVSVLEKELGPYTSDDCQPIDIPKAVRDYINDTNAQLDEAKSQVRYVSSLELDLKETNAKLDKALQEIKNLEFCRNELLEKMKMKEAQIIEITGQLDEITESKNLAEQTIETLNTVKAEKERNCQLIKNERDRLKRAIIEKTKLFDERIDEAVENERIQQKETMARLEKRYLAQHEVLKCDVEEKAKKLSDTKKLVVDLERQLTENQERYQRRIADLEQQNQRLAAAPRSRDSLSQEDQDILRTANSQRSMMMSKLRDFSSSCNTEVSLESSLVDELGQLLDRCFKSSGVWTDRRVKKAVSILINRLLALEQVSCV